MTMYIFKIITLLGGLALFLFGMDIMGKSLERTAGGKLQTILAKMSSTVFRGFLLGMAVTAGLPVMGMILFFMTWAILETNFSSNIVTTTMVSAVALSVLTALPAGSVNVGAVVCMVGFAAAVPATILVYLNAACVFLPYWKLIGLV